MLQSNETLEKLNARHLTYAQTLAGTVQKQLQKIMERAKEDLAKLEIARRADVELWQRRNAGEPEPPAKAS